MVSWKDAAENTERVCNDALVMPSSTGRPSAGLPLMFGRLLVGLVHLEQIDLFAGEQRRVAAVGDFHLLHHLADDHFDVLVVDLHALQPIDVLDFLDEIGRQFLHALDAQDVMRRRIAFDDVIALLDDNRLRAR